MPSAKMFVHVLMYIVHRLIESVVHPVVGARPHWNARGNAVEGNAAADKEGDIEDGQGGVGESPASASAAASSFRWLVH